MAAPTGNGTEILKTALQKTVSSTWLSLFTLADNHIYTILSVVFFEKDQLTTHTANLSLYSATGSAFRSQILGPQALPSNGTFVFNDKIVLNAADLDAVNSGTWTLEVKSTTAANSGGIMALCSYIDQDWSGSN